MGKYIDGNGLSHFMGIIKGALSGKVDTVSGKGLSTNDYTTTEKNKLAGIESGAEVNVQSDWNQSTSTADDYIKNKPTIPTANTTATNIKMDGTQSAGSLATFAKADHVHPSDTSKVPTTRKVNGHELSADVTVTKADVGLGSVTDGAEVNQNAFSNVKVGSVTVAADSKTDTLELAAGSNITLTPDTTNDKVTIAATDTTYSDFTYSAHGLVPQPPASLGSYEKEEMVISADGAWRSIGEVLNEAAGGFSSGIIKVEENNGEYFVKAAESNDIPSLPASKITSGTFDAARIPSLAISKITNLQTTLDAKAPLASPALTGTPTAPTAAAGTNTTQIATTAFVTNAVGTATAGALQYKGTVAAESTITGAAYKKGWYYVVSTAGTYVGKVCEVGDMLIAKQDKTSTPANDWDAIQSNIEVLSNSEIDALWAAA